ncbi:MAG: hypothetical protein ACI9D0_001090 [Bacteroidia bacterium]|jgi:hypothetical protein
MMNLLTLASVGCVALLACTPGDVDDLPRERGGQNDQLKDSLEGALAPTLKVRDWMNTDALSLANLRGKVVVLKFWGVW